MNQIARYDKPVGSLILTWILMPLLMYLTSASFFFQHAGDNNKVAANGGAMVETQSADDTIFGRLEVVLIFGTIVVLLASRQKEITAACIENPVLATLPVLAIASTAWSQFPKDSLHYSVLLLACTLFAFYFVKRFRPDQQKAVFLLFGWIAVVLSCVISVAAPKYGVDYKEGVAAWQGIYVQKNSCAISTIFLLAVAFFHRTPGRRGILLRAAYVVLSLFLLVMTESRTGWLVAAVLIAFVAAYRLVLKFNVRDRAMLVPTTLAIAGVIIVVGVVSLTTILVALGKDPTLTGRTVIWSAALDSAWKKPLLGYGYRAFWHGLNGESANVITIAGWMVPHAHNGFLETWLDLGLVGLVLVVITLFQAIRNALFCIRTAKPSPVIGWYISIILVTVLCNLDERTFLFPISLNWIMYVIACVGLQEHAKRLRMAQFAFDRAAVAAAVS